MNQNLVIINGASDISALDLTSETLGRKHLLVVCNYNDVRNELVGLLKAHNIYSVILVSTEKETFEEDAKLFATVPFFYISDEDKANAFVDSLIKSPMEVVMKAINGEEVAVSFSQGYPS